MVKRGDDEFPGPHNRKPGAAKRQKRRRHRWLRRVDRRYLGRLIPLVNAFGLTVFTGNTDGKEVIQ